MSQKLSLFEHQKKSVAFLSAKRRAFDFSEAGTGKTAASLRSIVKVRTPRAVVVCPPCVVGNWVDEIALWAPRYTVKVQETTKAQEPPKVGEVVVTTYTRAKFADGPLGVVVLDEAHKTKNEKSQIFDRMVGLRKRAGAIWALTATPILRDPRDLWTLIQLLGLERATYGNVFGFARFFGMDMKKALYFGKPRKDAWDPLERFMVRHPREVLKKLPERIREKYYGQILSKKDVKLFSDIVEKYPEDHEVWHLPAAPGALSRAMAKYSLVKAALTPAILEFLDLEPKKESPIVFFTAHRDAAEFLAKRYDLPLLIGGIPDAKRTQIVRAFQAGQFAGVVATIQASGVGITLTRAATVVFVSQTYVPALNSQAADRVYRIGQTQTVRQIEIRTTHKLENLLQRVLARKKPFMFEDQRK